MHAKPEAINKKNRIRCMLNLQAQILITSACAW
jgi:hypothetical protein